MKTVLRWSLEDATMPVLRRGGVGPSSRVLSAGYSSCLNLPGPKDTCGSYAAPPSDPRGAQTQGSWPEQVARFAFQRSAYLT